jgi:4-hydroxybenzoate polyprenyltransferase
LGRAAGLAAAAGAAETAETVRGTGLGLFVSHLRLPFQLLLAPIFMLGAWIGGGHPGLGLGLAFLAVHAGIYGGMTAFNSYYDHDRGPIGFMKHPRAASRAVRNGALAVQMAGILLLLLISPLAAVPALLLVLMGIAYSHPRWRWKGNLGASLAAVGVGQGILAFAIGFLAAGASVREILAPGAMLPALGSAFVTLGLYPITQLYQMDEDRSRGDRTLPLAVGFRGAIVIAGLLVGVGVALIAWALRSRIAGVWPPVLLGGVVAFWGALGLWARRFPKNDTYRNHDWAMAVSASAAAGFWVFILTEWLRIGR